MNAVATVPTKSVTLDMANRYGMEPAAFEATLRNTIMPMQRGQVMQATREEFAAFLLVAKEYRLNPITRQIYAFPKKGGGIIPVVSVDGWAFLINEHPAFDGMEFEDHHDDKGNLLSVTCRIFRKDRRMPVSVTEYLSECKRDTEPWAMRHRMLRHKSLIQCARYAFAFSGIYDEDEAERFAAIPAAGAAMVQTPPPAAPRRQAAPAPAPAQIEHQAAVPQVSDHEREVLQDRQQAVQPVEVEDADFVSKESLLTDLDERLGFARTPEEVEEAYTDFDAEALLSDYEGGVEAARGLRAKHSDRTMARGALKPGPAAPADDFPGNDAIADAQSAAPVKDPLAIPERFKGGGHYQIFIRGAADAAKPGDAERLTACWNETKAAREELHVSGQLENVDVKMLREAVGAALDRIRPPAPHADPVPQEAHQAASPAAGQSGTAGQPAPASDDPVAAYTARLEAAFKAAKTKEDVDRFWFGTNDVRDEETGATEDQRARWRLARNKAKSALPAGAA